MRLLLAITFCAAALCIAAEPSIETGDINGAKFRIDIPSNWNGGLIMYCHGYATAPTTYKPDGKLNDRLMPFLDAGYAVAQSGYSAYGWAVQEAIDDTQELRRYFIAKHGKPKETIISGHSMGGFTTMALIEKYPTDYDAALPFCGPLAATTWYKLRTAFDGRVLFDYYWPGVLPNPSKVPQDYQRNAETEAKVIAALESKPEQAEALRHYLLQRTNRDLANNLTFWTYQLYDMQQRAGGNPFDNRNTIYTNLPDNNTVNDNVVRYKADPRAAEYLKNFYVPTGHLTRPMLAVHTTYDPLVPTWVPSMYGVLAQDAGSADLFVLQYVKHDGHCQILPNEIAVALQELRQWKDAGVRPKSGLVP
ncbi:MAG: alpha/beta fold hydrolase [Bryobacteraceae bacterium]